MANGRAISGLDYSDTMIRNQLNPGFSREIGSKSCPARNENSLCSQRGMTIGSEGHKNDGEHATHTPRTRPKKGSVVIVMYNAECAPAVIPKY